jgi:hypothetical protein
VDGKLVCEAVIRCQVVPRQRKTDVAQVEAPEAASLEPVGAHSASLTPVNGE